MAKTIEGMNMHTRCCGHEPTLRVVGSDGYKTFVEYQCRHCTKKGGWAEDGQTAGMEWEMSCTRFGRNFGSEFRDTSRENEPNSGNTI